MEKVVYKVDKFTDFTGTERQFVCCAISEYDKKKDHKFLLIGFAVQNPKDKEMNEELGKRIAYGKAKSQKSGYATVFSSKKSIITQKVVETIIDEQIRFFKESPHNFIKGYLKDKELFDNNPFNYQTKYDLLTSTSNIPKYGIFNCGIGIDKTCGISTNSYDKDVNESCDVSKNCISVGYEATYTNEILDLTTIEDLRSLIYGESTSDNKGDVYEPVQDIISYTDLENRCETHDIVIRRESDGKFFAFSYDYSYDWDDEDCIEAEEVFPQEETIIVYK